MLKLSAISLLASRSLKPQTRSLRLKIERRHVNTAAPQIIYPKSNIYSSTKFFVATSAPLSSSSIRCPTSSQQPIIATKNYSTSTSPNLPPSNNKWDVSSIYAKMVHFFKLGWQGVKQLYYNTKEANKISKRL